MGAISCCDVLVFNQTAQRVTPRPSSGWLQTRHFLTSPWFLGIAPAKPEERGRLVEEASDGIMGLLDTGMRGKRNVFPEVVTESCLGVLAFSEDLLCVEPPGLPPLPPARVCSHTGKGPSLCALRAPARPLHHLHLRGSL